MPVTPLVMAASQVTRSVVVIDATATADIPDCNDRTHTAAATATGAETGLLVYHQLYVKSACRCCMARRLFIEFRSSAHTNGLYVLGPRGGFHLQSHI